MGGAAKDVLLFLRVEIRSHLQWIIQRIVFRILLLLVQYIKVEEKQISNYGIVLDIVASGEDVITTTTRSAYSFMYKENGMRVFFIPFFFEKQLFRYWIFRDYDCTPWCFFHCDPNSFRFHNYWINNQTVVSKKKKLTMVLLQIGTIKSFV